MTVAELYACDPTLRALIDLWVSDRHCPLPLVERLLELDQPAAAECARWAASTPDREVWFGDALPPSVYPTRSPEVGWFWYTGYATKFADWIPKAGLAVTGVEYPSIADAITGLLDGWVPEAQTDATASNVSTEYAKVPNKDLEASL